MDCSPPGSSVHGSPGKNTGVVCVDHNKLWKILKEMGIPDHLTCLLRNLYAGSEGAVKPHMEQWAGSKLGREYDKAVYCPSAYLTSMHPSKIMAHITKLSSCELPGWVNHNLESRWQGEISTISDMQMILL